MVKPLIVLQAGALLLLLGSIALGSTDSRDLTIASSISKDLKSLKNGNFGNHLKTWEATYGSDAVGPLLTLASNISFEDSQRYAALMGAIKLGGNGVATNIIPFLKDRSWMLRSGAIRGLTIIGSDIENAKIIPLLKDPALVVRLEAVEAIVQTHPPGTLEALVTALNDPGNFHRGKAQWIPQRALAGIAKLYPKQSSGPSKKEVLNKIIPLLGNTQDFSLLEATVSAIETLKGQTPQKQIPLFKRVAACKLAAS